MSLTDRENGGFDMIEDYHVYIESAKSFLPVDHECWAYVEEMGASQHSGIDDGTGNLVISGSCRCWFLRGLKRANVLRIVRYLR